MNTKTDEGSGTAGPVDCIVRPGAEARLPVPRLQLRWLKSDDARYQWMCHYELVMPLREHDIRREVYDDEGMQTGEVDELVVPLKEPSCRSGGGTPCRTPDGASYYDAPYRDGAHARWDSEALGGLPVYVIDLQGVAHLKA